MDQKLVNFGDKKITLDQFVEICCQQFQQIASMKKDLELKAEDE